MKTKEDIFEFMNSVRVFCLATLEKGKPKARFMLMFRADKNGIIFNTSKMKDVYSQLIENPDAEICFYDQKENIQVRVCGRFELVDDLELKKEIVTKHEFLKPFVEKNGYDSLAPFCMKNGNALVWTFADNFAPKQPISL